MNIQRTAISAAVMAVAFCAALPAFADPPPMERTTTTTTTTTKHNYVYYRDHDIYFAPETKTYYWMEDGRWQSGPVLPQEDQVYVKGGGTTIVLDTDRPYERHDYVVARYKNAAPETTTTERTVTSNEPGERTVTTTTTKHRYVYYGDHDIYFAPETKTYYWMADGRWRSGNTLPAEDVAYVKSGGVTIELDTERPYERHDYVIAHYKHRHDRDDDDRH